MNKELLLVVDFGAHNNQQVAKVARLANVYCEVKPFTADIKGLDPKAIIIIGDDEVNADISKVKAAGLPLLDMGNTRSDDEINSFINECGFSCDWTIDAFIEDAVAQIRKTVGDKKVLCALSGGVDSSVCAALVYKAIGNQLTCMFVNHGLMRKGEPEMIDQIFGKQFGMPLVSIDAVDRFLGKLEGVDEPEKKRKIIGEEFIRVFEDESKNSKIPYLTYEIKL